MWHKKTLVPYFCYCLPNNSIYRVGFFQVHFNLAFFYNRMYERNWRIRHHCIIRRRFNLHCVTLFISNKATTNLCVQAMSQVWIILLPYPSSKGLKNEKWFNGFPIFVFSITKAFQRCYLREYQICSKFVNRKPVLPWDDSINPDLMIIKLLRWHIRYLAKGVMNEEQKILH